MKNFTHFNKKLLLAIIFLCSITFGFGQSIFENPITDGNPSTANPFILGQIVDANITASGIGRGIGINPNNGLNRYNANGWNTATLDNTAYFEFVITPNSGFEIDFVSFVYTSQRSNASIANFAFRSSLDGFTADIGTPDFNGTTIDLSAASYQGLTGSITFRFYAWGAGNSANTFSINDFIFNGSVSCGTTTTWNGTTWDNGIPGASVNARIDASYDSSTDGGSFEACSLTVNELDAGLNPIILYIQGTDYVSVQNDITIDGTIIVTSEASLVQVNDASTVTLNGTGIGEVQKTTTALTAWYDYTYWSSPVSNETIGSVFNLVPSNRIFEYDAANFEDTDNDGFDDDANDWSIASGVMTPGKGYAAVARPATMSFPETQAYFFNGQFNNGVITPLITMSSGANPKHWNFLGNPYPSPIDADLFIGDPANSGIIGGTLYFWTHNSPPEDINPGTEGLNFSVDDYASYNATGGVGTAAVSGNATNNNTVPTGIIATGQGFFVEGMFAGVATFNNSMRVNTGNDNFYRTSDRIWLNFKNDYGAFSQILIGFNENATDGFDRLYDGKRLDASSYVSFFSFIDDEKYAIQSKASIKEEESIPIGIMTTIEEEMEYSISIDNVEGILESSEVYLIDNDLGIEHNLNESAYSFNTLNGEFKDRFVLSLKTDSRLINPALENELIISSNEVGQDINFSTTQLSNITNVQIYDMLGRLLHNVDFNDETTTARITSHSLKHSLFVVKASLSDGKILTKKVLL